MPFLFVFIHFEQKCVQLHITVTDELAHCIIYYYYEDVVSVVTAQRMDGFYGQLNAMNQIDFIAK